METEIKMTDEQVRDNIRKQDEIRDNILSTYKLHFERPRCSWVNCITDFIELIPKILVKHTTKTFNLYDFVNLFFRKSQWPEVALYYLGYERKKGKAPRFYGHLTKQCCQRLGVYPTCRIKRFGHSQIYPEKYLKELREQ